MENTPLLVTGSIAVKARHTKIISTEVRAKQYTTSIIKWIACSKVKNIIFCENTGSHFDRETLSNVANHFNVKLEYVSFVGKESEIFRYGKGFGEGEIIEYAIHHSEILKRAQSFIKITGRVFVSNSSEMIASLDRSKNYFLQHRTPFAKSSNKVDTRFYHVNKYFYIKNLMGVYKNVDDDSGYFLEHAFYDSIRDHKDQISSFPAYPRFDGLSGSQGDSYSLGASSYFKYNLLCKLGFFNI